jgi:hypothetical protein
LYAERSKQASGLFRSFYGLEPQTSTQAPHMVQASVMKALPSRISIAPKGHAVTHVSQPVHLSGMTFTLTGNSLKSFQIGQL